jgi:hypothetical protein
MFRSLSESVVMGAATVELPSWLVIGATLVGIGLIVAIGWRLAGRLTRFNAAGTSFEFGELAEEKD